MHCLAIDNRFLAIVHSQHQKLVHQSHTVKAETKSQNASMNIPIQLCVVRDSRSTRFFFNFFIKAGQLQITEACYSSSQTRTGNVAIKELGHDAAVKAAFKLLSSLCLQPVHLEYEDNVPIR